MRSKTTYKKSEASRKLVIDAAVKTLAKHGFANTSVNDIAATAGMSKGVVHYHFASKDDLITQVLAQCSAALRERVQSAWAAPGTPPEKIRRAIKELWATRTDGSPEVRVMADLMALAVHDPKMKKALAAIFHASREEQIEEFLTSFKALGLRPRLPGHIVLRLLMATLDGLGLHHMFDPPNDEDSKELGRALEVIAFSLFEL